MCGRNIEIKMVFAVYIACVRNCCLKNKKNKNFLFCFLFFNYFPLHFLIFFSAVFVLSSLLLRTRAMFNSINQVCILSRVQFAA